MAAGRQSASTWPRELLPQQNRTALIVADNMDLCAQVVGNGDRAVPTLKLPAVDHWRAAEHYGPRRADVALPDAAIIELNADAIGRIDSALAARINPDSAVGRAPVRPGPVGSPVSVVRFTASPFCVTKAGAPSMPFRHIWMHR